MLALLPLALSVLPGIIDLLAGDKAGKVATNVASAVATVTGTTDPAAAQAVLAADPSKAVELRAKLADIALEHRRLELAEMQSARNLSATVPLVAKTQVVGFAAVFLIWAGMIGRLNIWGLPYGADATLFVTILSAVSGIFGGMIQFFYGNSTASHAANQRLDKIADQMATAPGQPVQQPPIATTGDVLIGNQTPGSTVPPVSITEPARQPMPADTPADVLNEQELTRPRYRVPAASTTAPPAVEAPTSERLITTDLLTRLGWVSPDAYATAMAAICPEFGITGRQRVAAWLAQTGHESGKGKWRKEIWGPTDAQKKYEMRADLGNDQPGDGSRYRGRGIIQVTGKYNYTQLAKALGISLDQTVTWLETIEGAVTGSAWWWKQHSCNELADAGDVRALTKRINGGYNGIDERERLYAEALRALG